MIGKKLFLASLTLLALSLLAACAKYEPEENFEVHSTGKETAITKYNGTAMVVKIPPKIDGRTVTEIGNEAFRDCTGIAEVTIPKSVTTIDDYAFNGCTGLTEVTIPKSVTKIGEGAFFSCTGLTKVTIPNSVTKIGKLAFYGCTRLKNVNVPKGTNVSSSAFPAGCEIIRY